LARALQGARTSPVKAGRFPHHGSLASWTQRGIGEFIAQLEEQGFLEPYRERGYRLLHLTDRGQAWLDAPPEIQAIAPVPSQPQADPPAEVDEALFDRLRTWRLETAQKIGKPPYVIFHNSVLQRIATQHPTTPDELLAIKGIGPAKLEQYGMAILGIVASQKDNG
jgi:superfamily II DNA helicase RecQ